MVYVLVYVLVYVVVYVVVYVGCLEECQVCYGNAGVYRVFIGI